MPVSVPDRARGLGAVADRAQAPSPAVCAGRCRRTDAIDRAAPPVVQAGPVGHDPVDVPDHRVELRPPRPRPRGSASCTMPGLPLRPGRCPRLRCPLERSCVGGSLGGNGRWPGLPHPGEQRRWGARPGPRPSSPGVAPDHLAWAAGTGAGRGGAGLCRGLRRRARRPPRSTADASCAIRRSTTRPRRGTVPIVSKTTRSPGRHSWR